MAEETSELSPSLQAKRSTHTPRTATVDTLTIAFEVEGGLDQLPESLRDLVYGEEYGPLMASASEVDAETAKTSLGERTVHSISIETHLPRLDSCEGGGGRTYASATANVSPSSSLRDEKGATTATLRDKIPFFSGIPAVECIKGVMHLFKHRYTHTFYASPSSPPVSHRQVRASLQLPGMCPLCPCQPPPLRPAHLLLLHPFKFRESKSDT
ncbi:hypothetical protein GBAR_LOCUS16791 [Geodia barretti]|uniref:Uncharacterized protein n=1 Tax=Geodia barretti TaxID=519541 RepID=A0AA35SH89_GEOBA|nr:hypothetical protein GBAR_LOCUS16791 [Geodia barretti]